MGAQRFTDPRKKVLCCPRPSCGATNIRYKKKKNLWHCLICGNYFNVPDGDIRLHVRKDSLRTIKNRKEDGNDKDKA